MFEKYINKLKDKVVNRHYAVFVDENGKQREILPVNNKNNKFKENEQLYLKDKNKYSNLTITDTVYYFFKRENTYFFYQYNYSEPINFTKDKLTKANDNQPYIAEDINTILETNVLKSLNTPKSDFFANLSTKQIMIGVGIVIAFIYIMMTGGF